MSWASTAWAEKVKTGSAATKLVLLVLANFADDEGFCFPSQKTLAAITECGERSIRRYLDHLENIGALRRVRRHREDGSKTSDGVFLAMDILPARIPTGQSGLRSDKTHPSGQALAGHEQPSEPLDSNKKDTARAPTFNPETGHVENLPTAMLGKWREAYPAINIDVQIAKAEAWLLANPKNRKSNYVRFLNGWLSRAQDSAPRASAKHHNSAHTNFGDKQYVGTADDEIDWFNPANSSGAAQGG